MILSSDTDKQFLLHILERAMAMPLRRIICSEVAPLPDGNWISPQNYNCVRVSIMLSGKSRICIWHRRTWQKLEFCAGEALVFTPLSWTAYPDAEPHIGENLGLVLQPDFLRLVYSSSVQEPGAAVSRSFHLNRTLRSSTAGILNLLPLVFQSGDVENSAGVLLRQALRQIRTDLDAATESEQLRSRKLWMRICAYMTENFSSIGPREETAEHFGISPGYLSNLFARYGRGMTFNQTVNQLRLESAAMQLAEGTDSCEAIARNCGFPSPSYFGVRFRRRYHCTPLEYRRLYRKRNGE